jgi:hypothetical protein
MKYIRTKDGRIVDIEKFINEEKDTPYYKDFIFEEITKDGELKWTAIGTEKCSIKDQIGRRCHFSATLNSEVINQANTIEELCDEFVVIGIFENQIGCCCDTFKEAKELKDYVELPQGQIIYGAIWTEKGLIYVAKMNDIGEWELL